MKASDVAIVVRSIGPAVEALAARIRALEEQTVALQRQVVGLRDRPSLKFRDAWAPNISYEIGDLVTLSGSTWICKLASTGVAPSTTGYGANAWSLFSSRGRDGRAARD